MAASMLHTKLLLICICDDHRNNRFRAACNLQHLSIENVWCSRNPDTIAADEEMTARIENAITAVLAQGNEPKEIEQRYYHFCRSKMWCFRIAETTTADEMMNTRAEEAIFTILAKVIKAKMEQRYRVNVEEAISF